QRRCAIDTEELLYYLPYGIRERRSRIDIRKEQKVRPLVDASPLFWLSISQRALSFGAVPIRRLSDSGRGRYARPVVANAPKVAVARHGIGIKKEFGKITKLFLIPNQRHHHCSSAAICSSTNMRPQCSQIMIFLR